MSETYKFLPCPNNPDEFIGYLIETARRGNVYVAEGMCEWASRDLEEAARGDPWIRLACDGLAAGGKGEDVGAKLLTDFCALTSHRLEEPAPDDPIIGCLRSVMSALSPEGGDLNSTLLRSICAKCASHLRGTIPINPVLEKFLIDAFTSASEGKDINRALFLKRGRGRAAADNSRRNMQYCFWMSYFTGRMGGLRFGDDPDKKPGQVLTIRQAHRLTMKRLRAMSPRIPNLEPLETDVQGKLYGVELFEDYRRGNN